MGWFGFAESALVSIMRFSEIIKGWKGFGPTANTLEKGESRA
jgi:hypothetical protein